MKIKFSIGILFIIFLSAKCAAQASFSFIDSTCFTQPVSLVNNSTNANNYCWSFDSININGTKSCAYLGNYGSTLGTPVGGRMVEDGGNFYLFITNYSTNNLVRWDLGTNPLNTVPIGSVVIPNILPGNFNEDIEFFKENGNWYAIANGGGPSYGLLGRLDFGANITNATPTFTTIAATNIGQWPHQLNIFKSGANYVGFMAGRQNGDIRRLDFGTSILNTPTITTIANVGSNAANFAMEEEYGNWYMIVSENVNPASIIRLDFGNNLLNNSPTINNMGALGNILKYPRAVKLFKSCNQVFGLMNIQKSTAASLPGDVILLTFPTGITGTVTGTSLGTFSGSADYWGQASNVFWSGNDFHFFIINPLDLDIARMDISPTAYTLPLSFVQSPTVNFGALGQHQVSLLTNFGQPNQSFFCDAYTSVTCCANSYSSINLCPGDSAVLNVTPPTATSISWLPITNLSCNNCASAITHTTTSTLYIATSQVGSCTQYDSFQVNFLLPTYHTINDSICIGQNYTLPGGSIANSAGNYVDTILNMAGCDSIVTINLSIISTINKTVTATICNNQTYTLPNGNIVNTAANYIDTLTTMYGCDSIIHTNLSVYTISSALVNASICSNQPYTLPGGSIVNTAGLYADTLLNFHGCDSIIQTNLIVNLISNQFVNASICNNQTYTLPSGSIVNTGGTYIDTFANYHGCDSIIQTNLSIRQVSGSVITTSICSNQTYTLPGGSIVNTAGLYADTILNFHGCDSIIQTNLSVLSSSSSIVTVTICSNQTYTLPGGSIVNTAGSYADTILNFHGCDSIIQINLVVKPTSSSTVSATICSNQTYTLPNGSIVNTAGSYPTVLINYLGCDSTIVTTLSVANMPIINLGSDTSICNGSSIILNALQYAGANYLWNNNSIANQVIANTAGLYTLQISNPPCPSVVDSMQLSITECDCNMFMPNAFTPNGDLLNDVVMPIMDCSPSPTDYEFSIYNRWGKCIFKTTNLNTGWDGKYKNQDQEIGTYAYFYHYTFSGVPVKVVKGTIALLR